MNNKSQIWIETVIYTLIGLAIIGILLAFAVPEIQEKKDQMLVKQSIDMLRQIENKIEEVRYYGPGNRRVIETKIEKGNLIINPKQNAIEYNTKSKYMYSQPGEEVEIGNINSTTKEVGEEYEIMLELKYENINITFLRKEKNKTLNPSPTPYKLTVENLGGNLVNIDFSVD